ncbi:hypothetical protein G647_03394 [Cladophialophora carrionii CBS 160.54]|uniref:F-box domain-containing protein n=1 Tax=Cladophialophora carrionii CBS 160.54 TaxID=1279043 RepID=V9DB03_9EURO|nr:uncharacterized protein G647_03394 [Cladophialophora carrionii CBS 160.54]ETI24025.1 hypothetical protein G647_03394 [Cladophialophora carrionii CBS 160.54]
MLPSELQPYNMGKSFTDLPAELHIQIFKESIKQRSISMLYLNRALYHELLPELYDFHVFKITIDPSAADFRVALFDGTEHFLPAHSDHIREPSCLVGKKIPFENLKEIQIDILPPDHREPAQLICAWMQITRLLAWLLPQAEAASRPLCESQIKPATNNTGLRLPHVHVAFLEQEGRQWQKSIAVNAGQPEMIDLNVLLSAFRRIRYAQRFSVTIPNACKTDHLSQYCSDTERLVTRQSPFGSQPGDSRIQSIEDYLHTTLDCILDDLPGTSAAQLRLERFASWCSHYEDCHLRRISGYPYGNRPGQFGGIQNAVTRRERDRAFKDRLDGFVMYSLAVSKARRPLPWHEQWAAVLPRGIPPKSSDEYLDMLHSEDGVSAMLAGLMGRAVDLDSRLRFRYPCCQETASVARPP